MWQVLAVAIAALAAAAAQQGAATAAEPPGSSGVRPAPSEDSSGVSVTVDAEGATPVGAGLKVLLKLYDDCSRRDGLMSCVKVKAATLLDRVARAGDLPLSETLTLVRRDGSARMYAARAMSENELEASLPSDSYAAKDARLNEVLLERVARVLGSHSIQLNFPKVTAAEMRGLGGLGGLTGGGGGTGICETNSKYIGMVDCDISGRGKMKGMMKMMMMGAAMGMMGMLPVMMGGVSMMAFKALIVSKLALVMAIIMVLKKLMGGGGGGGGHSGGGGGGWSSGGGGGYGGGGGGGGWDRRAFAEDNAAQYMAYHAQAAAAANTIGTNGA